jgi:hypothetical protein
MKDVIAESGSNQQIVVRQINHICAISLTIAGVSGSALRGSFIRGILSLASSSFAFGAEPSYFMLISSWLLLMITVSPE